MNRVKIFFPAVLSVMLWGAVTHGQTKSKKGEKVHYQGETFLQGRVGNGTISKKMLDSLIRLPLVSSDSLGRLQPVTSFKLTWAELALYEDSTGRPLIMADYYEAFSDEETFTVAQPWLDLILNRSKPGDTLTFSYVTAVMAPPAAPLPSDDSVDGGVSVIPKATDTLRKPPDTSDTAASTVKKKSSYYYRSADLRLIITE